MLTIFPVWATYPAMPRPIFTRISRTSRPWAILDQSSFHSRSTRKRELRSAAMTLVTSPRINWSRRSRFRSEAMALPTSSRPVSFSSRLSRTSVFITCTPHEGASREIKQSQPSDKILTGQALPQRPASRLPSASVHRCRRGSCLRLRLRSGPDGRKVWDHQAQREAEDHGDQAEEERRPDPVRQLPPKHGRDCLEGPLRPCQGRRDSSGTYDVGVQNRPHDGHADGGADVPEEERQRRDDPDLVRRSRALHSHDRRDGDEAHAQAQDDTAGPRIAERRSRLQPREQPVATCQAGHPRHRQGPVSEAVQQATADGAPGHPAQADGGEDGPSLDGRGPQDRLYEERDEGDGTEHGDT